MSKTKSRINVPATTIKTREQMEALVGDITALITKQQKLTAELNRRVNEVRQDYEASLGQIAEDIEAKTALARDWAEANQGEFGKAKSISLTHGIVGWRIGNVTLKTLAGWTWDRVLEKLATSPGWDHYIRTKREVNKESLLAAREELDLKQVGVRVVQDERFFVETKVETVDSRVNGEAQ